jgi:uncharacterized membrane protein YhaH (DUF805 family)
MNWYIKVLKNYAVFGGRAQRSEYWYFALFNILANIGLFLIDGVLGTLNPEIGLGLLGGIYVLAIIIPGIAVTIRRLHDTNRSGWWSLVVFIPVIGVIALLVLMVLDSTPGNNKYGPNPKEPIA